MESIIVIFVHLLLDCSLIFGTFTFGGIVTRGRFCRVWLIVWLLWLGLSCTTSIFVGIILCSLHWWLSPCPVINRRFPVLWLANVCHCCDGAAPSSVLFYYCFATCMLIICGDGVLLLPHMGISVSLWKWLCPNVLLLAGSFFTSWVVWAVSLSCIFCKFLHHVLVVGSLYWWNPFLLDMDPSIAINQGMTDRSKPFFLLRITKLPECLYVCLKVSYSSCYLRNFIFYYLLLNCKYFSFCRGIHKFVPFVPFLSYFNQLLSI